MQWKNNYFKIVMILFMVAELYSVHASGMSATPYLRDGQREAAEKYGKGKHRMFSPVNVRQEAVFGEKQQFWTKNFIYDRSEQITAVCQDVGIHCYVFVDENLYISRETIEQIKNEFDNNIYMTDTSVFGSEPNPGVDGDKRIYILVYDIKDYYFSSGMYFAGYFNYRDEYSSDDFPMSNEREMVYMDYNPTLTSGNIKEFFGVLAHEFQHMIHWNSDAAEETWLDEGCADYAVYLCGYGHPEEHVTSFLKKPGISLTEWNQTIEDYGISYLFVTYLAERFGSRIVKEIVGDGLHGAASVNYILKNYGTRFDAIFSDFTIANYVNNRKYENGKYGYSYSTHIVKPEKIHAVFPAAGEFEMPGNSGNYIIAQSSVPNTIICGFNRKTPDISLNIVYMQNNDIVMIEQASFKTSDYFEKEFSGFGDEYNKILLIPVNTGTNAAKISYTFSTHAPKMRILANPLVKNMAILIEGKSVEELTVTGSSSSETLEPRILKTGLYAAWFYPTEDGYYEVYVKGTDSDGNKGFIRRVVNMQILFKTDLITDL